MAAMENGDEFDPVENFIDQMGLITQSDGGPRIAGRIFGLLLVEGRPFTLHEMADRLKISRASASTNARLLADRGMVRLMAHAGDRQDYYAISAQPYTQMLENVRGKMMKSAQLIAEAEALFTDADDEARSRVGQLADFYRQSADFMTQWAARLTQAP